MSGWRQSKGQGKGSEQLGRVFPERAHLNCDWNYGKGPAIRSKCEVREGLHRSWQVWREGGRGIRESEDSVCIWKIENGFPSGLGAFGLRLSRAGCLLECGRLEEVPRASIRRAPPLTSSLFMVSACVYTPALVKVGRMRSLCFLLIQQALTVPMMGKRLC